MRPALTALALAAILAAAGCGGEREFSPEEFVDAANSEGAGLELGSPLLSAVEGIDVYELRLRPTSVTGAGEHSPPGSLTVTDGTDSALSEFRRCDSAGTLACYRAANVVIAFEGTAEDPKLASVESAIKAMATD
jgi:hypothetical protein